MRTKAFGALALAVICFSSCARQPLRVGFIAGLTGNQAELGLACRDGAILAIEEANAEGGLRGRRVELVIEDDGNDEATLKAALQRFKDKGIGVVLGPATSAMADKALALAPDILFISPTASAERLAGKDDNLIRLMASNARAASLLAKEVVEKRKLKTVAIAWDEGNKSYAVDYVAAFSAAWKAAGAEAPLESSFARIHGDSDLERAAKDLAKAGKESVLIIASGADAATMIRVLEREGFHGLVMVAGWAVTSDIAAFGTRTIEGVVFAQQYNPSSMEPAVVHFRERYEARFGARPAFGALFGWEAARTLLSALAGSRLPQASSVKKAILEAPALQGLEGPISFDKAGDLERTARVFVFRGGQAIPLP